MRPPPFVVASRDSARSTDAANRRHRSCWNEPPNPMGLENLLTALLRTDPASRSFEENVPGDATEKQALRQRDNSMAEWRFGLRYADRAGALLPPPIPARTCAMDWSRAGRSVSRLGYWVGSLVLCVALGMQSSIAVNVAAATLSLSMAAADLGRWRTGGVTAITLHSLLSSATAMANVVGLASAGSLMRERYFLYSVEEHLYLASVLQLTQGCLPVLGFWSIARTGFVVRALRLSPTLEGGTGTRPAITAGIVLSAAAIAANAGARLRFVDTFASLLIAAPSIAAFVLARLGAERRHCGAMTAGIAIALADAARAFFFDYLRGTIAQPLVAFTCGAVLGARSLRPLRDPHFVPVLAVGALFVMFYGLLGETRERGVHGVARFTDMHEYHQWRAAQPDIAPQQTIVARLTSFNQLSQIGALIDRNGFYGGRTFEYLRYALTPRAIWPEKPKIALGAWYAMEIGQAVPTANGWYNNSVNMTQAGELYLNFGWLGVIVGLPLFGGALAFFWTRANFWELGARNIAGSAFAAIMFWTVLGGHGEFTLLVTLLGIFLALYGFSILIGSAQLVWALLRSPRAGSELRQVLVP